MSQNNIIIGILAALPPILDEPAIFVDILRLKSEINRLKEDHTTRFKKTLPRKKARYDRVLDSDKRCKQMLNKGDSLR